MVPFQGSLKKRTEQDVAELKQSILTDGLLMPFALWRNSDGHNMILDGHGRYAALVQIALEDPEVLTQELPCVYIEAETEDDARKALLQIVSIYGRVSRPGVIKFMETVKDYTAPVIRSISKPEPIHVEPHREEYAVIKIRVKKEQVQQLTAILGNVHGLEIL
jgi:hypothetical protein